MMTWINFIGCKILQVHTNHPRHKISKRGCFHRLYVASIEQKIFTTSDVLNVKKENVTYFIDLKPLI